MAKKKVTYWFGADITEFEKKVKQLDRQLYKTGKSIGNFGMAFTKSITAPLTAMGLVATKAALNVEKALSGIARGTGASGAALKGLEKDWKALAGKVDDSFETSAKVLADYNTRLGLTGSALQEISKQALDAAQMLGEEVNSVVRESAKAMQDWGVASSEMAGYMDKIFVASQQTGVGMAALSTNMYKYGSALRQMGFDADATIATLAQFDKQGVNTELVMGSLRIALGKMAKAGISDAGEAFKVLTDQIKNAESPTEATRLAIELFGAKAGPDMAAAIREGRFELGNLTEALNTSRGAIEKADAATETFGERWGEVKNKVQIAIEPIGKAILKIADSYIPTLEGKIDDISKAIGNMSQESIASMLKWAGIMAAGGPILLGMAAIIASARTILGLFTAMMAHPAVTLAVGVGAAGFYTGKKLADWQNANTPTYKPYEAGQASTGLGALQDKIKNAINSPKAFDLNAFLSRLPKKPAAIPSVGAISLGGGSSGSKSKSGKTAAEEALERIKKKAQEAGEAVAAALSRLEAQKTALEEAKSAATEGISKYYESLKWENSQGLLGDTEYLDALKRQFSELSTELEALGLDMQNVSNWSEPMRQAFSEIQSVAGRLATDTMDLLQKQFESGTMTNAQYLSALEAIKTKFAEYPAVVKMAEEAIQAFNLSAQASLPTVAGQVQSAWDDMNMAIAQAPSSIGDAFVSAIRGAENLGDAMRNLLKDIGAVIVKAFLMKTLFGGIGGTIGGGGGISSLFGSAQGNVFNQQGLVPFANGGIVNKPTIFPFANGVGLMGEAGAEAIMPLKRTPSGDLGVQADGGGGTTNITMNINAVDSQSFIQMLRNNKAAVESLVIENIYRNGSVRKAIQQGV